MCWAGAFQQAGSSKRRPPPSKLKQPPKTHPVWGCWGLGCPGLEGVQLRAAAGLSHTRTRGGDGAACHSPKRPNAPGISAGLTADAPQYIHQDRAASRAPSPWGAFCPGRQLGAAPERLGANFYTYFLFRFGFGEGGSSCCPGLRTQPRGLQRRLPHAVPDI